MFIPQLPSSSYIVVPSKYIFLDTTERDNYFVTTPSELTDERVTYTTSNGKLWQYELDTTTWLDVSPTIRGATGATGATGAKGDPGEFPTIHDLDEKSILVNGDFFIIEDSEDGYTQKKVRRTSIGGGSLDTNIVEPENDQVLKYNEDTEKWINVTPSWVENDPVDVESGQIPIYYESGSITNSTIVISDNTIDFKDRSSKNLVIDCGNFD